MSLRSPLGRALGRGSARDGTAHWWAQRVTSVALIPLTIWFFVALLMRPSLDFASLRAWMVFPVNAFLCVLLSAVTAYHSYLGTMVVVEDYVHTEWLKVATLMALRFSYVLVGGAAIFAIMRVAFGASA